MIRVKILFPQGADVTFDWNYYRSVHHSLVEKKINGYNVVSYDVEKGLSSNDPESLAPFILIANLSFNSLEDAKKCMDEVSKEIMEDLPNFTNIKPIIQISKSLY